MPGGDNPDAFRGDRGMLIKNGRILDPANGTDTISDILIKGERISIVVK